MLACIVTSRCHCEILTEGLHILHIKGNMNAMSKAIADTSEDFEFFKFSLMN
jgi:hypothetical protein